MPRPFFRAFYSERSLQKPLVKTRRIGYISNLPHIIRKDITILEKSLTEYINSEFGVLVIGMPVFVSIACEYKSASYTGVPSRVINNAPKKNTTKNKRI